MVTSAVGSRRSCRARAALAVSPVRTSTCQCGCSAAAARASARPVSAASARSGVIHSSASGGGRSGAPASPRTQRRQRRRPGLAHAGRRVDEAALAARVRGPDLFLEREGGVALRGEPGAGRRERIGHAAARASTLGGGRRRRAERRQQLGLLRPGGDDVALLHVAVAADVARGSPRARPPARGCAARALRAARRPAPRTRRSARAPSGAPRCGRRCRARVPRSPCSFASTRKALQHPRPVGRLLRVRRSRDRRSRQSGGARWNLSL